METKSEEHEFKLKLRELCVAYDSENDEYPEHQYEGLALFEFYLKDNDTSFEHYIQCKNKRYIQWKDEL